MSEFETLLSVQDHDTTLDQLRHKRAALPQRSALSAVESERATSATRLAELEAERGVLEARRSALEAEVAELERRASDLDRRMRSGEVTATRELTAMVEQVDSLKRRRSMLEDEELELMVALEPLDDVVATLRTQIDRLEQQAGILGRDLAVAEAEIDRALGLETDARAAKAVGVPEPLLSRYEQLRARLGGIGAARMVGSSCGGCHLAFSASEVDRMRREPPQAVITCDQCGRILVR
jgi:predicted  nucleic acid-binding Zn-ribbon protein